MGDHWAVEGDSLKMARYIALTCEALARSIYAVAAQTPHTVSVHLYRQGLHNSPRTLRQVLQEQIDSIAPGACDAILLVYGMCGASTVGLVARHTPLVMPRAHDCITPLSGFPRTLSAGVRAASRHLLVQRRLSGARRTGAAVALGASGIEEQAAQYEEWVRKWGEETADALLEEMRSWTQHYTRAAFIDTGLGDPAPYEQIAKTKRPRGVGLRAFSGQPASSGVIDQRPVGRRGLPGGAAGACDQPDIRRAVGEGSAGLID